MSDVMARTYYYITTFKNNMTIYHCQYYWYFFNVDNSVRCVVECAQKLIIMQEKNTKMVTLFEMCVFEVQCML